MANDVALAGVASLTLAARLPWDTHIGIVLPRLDCLVTS
jgi:hypothetical protein